MDCLDLWKKFLDCGCSINVCDNIKTIFYEDKLDVTIRNNEGESALHAIARRKRTPYTTKSHDKHLSQLFLKELDPLSEDQNGRTALDVAAATGKTGILELFQRA